jgi:hypothetical protein
MVASFGEACQGRADLQATTKSVKGQDLALLSSTTAAERLRSTSARSDWTLQRLSRLAPVGF